MPFLIVRNDITKVYVDAIVNPANTKLKERSKTSRTIHLTAGEDKLNEACSKICHCKPGKAVLTEGVELSAKYIIHAVSPVWKGGIFGEKKMLYKAYTEALKLAKESGINSIAFPLFSSVNCDFPRDKAFKVAISAISDFLMENDILVYMVLYDRDSVTVSRKVFRAIDEYIDEHYTESNNERYCSEEAAILDSERDGWGTILLSDEPKNSSFQEVDDVLTHWFAQKPTDAPPPQDKKIRQLEDIMEHLGETFSQMLLRLIDEKGYTDAQVYRKANIDRRHFSKIRNNAEYVPHKKTAMAFVIALELSLDEAKDLLKTAGFSFSDSSKFDVIVSFFLDNKIYDVFEINEVLFSYDQPLIGG